MCGIYGTVFHYDKEIIKKKLEIMKFRGPNHTGSLQLKSPNNILITLGHVRLSIIDLEIRSNQPFQYNDDISIVFNGEVYNYLELKKQFLGDVVLRTESDTEVICAMYEKFGPKCVEKFNGMFAYAIYDRKRNIIVGARDRLGKKPFFYWLSNEGLEFASQPKVIAYGNHFTIDPIARQFYLIQGVIPDPYSPYTEIKKLRAGEQFIYHLDTKFFDLQTYWDLHTNSCHFQPPKTNFVRQKIWLERSLLMQYV